MFVDGIRHQTSMSVASGQCAQALSHAAAPQKGLYSDRPHGKKKNTLCGTGDEASTVYQFHLQIMV